MKKDHSPDFKDRKMESENKGPIFINRQVAQRPSAPSNVDAPQRHSPMFWGVFVVSQVFSIVCLILMIVWTVKYQGKMGWSENKFNYHPLYMEVGLIFLYGEAILIYRIFPNLPKTLLKFIHAILHLGAISFTIAALVAVFLYKKENAGKDLYTLHSWIGISCVGLFGLQYIMGFGTFLLPWASVSLRAKVLPFHTYFGVGIFLLAVAAALTGMMEKLGWTSNYSNFAPAGLMGNFFGLFLVMSCFLILFLVTKKEYKRQPRLEDSYGASTARGTYAVNPVN